jgi:hypothetical protein
MIDQARTSHSQQFTILMMMIMQGVVTRNLHQYEPAASPTPAFLCHSSPECGNKHAAIEPNVHMASRLPAPWLPPSSIWSLHAIGLSNGMKAPIQLSMALTWGNTAPIEQKAPKWHHTPPI